MLPFWNLEKETSCSVTIRKQRDEELEGLASLKYHERITQFARGSISHLVDETTTVIDFRPLYAITLHDLHRQLAEQVQLIMKNEITDDQLKLMRRLSKRYSILPFFPSRLLHYNPLLTMTIYCFTAIFVKLTRSSKRSPRL